MKARVQNCDQCRNQISKEQDKLCGICQYEMFTATLQDIGKAVVVAVIAVLDRRGLSPKYIKKFFDDIVFILEYPEVYGKDLRSDEMQKKLAEKYELDFDRIKFKHESKKEYFHRNKIR